jgi:hypothetical protein
MKKKILLTLLALFVIIQFIRPSRNLSAEMSTNDISRHFTVPDTVKNILSRSCNDCHSNNTIYPWYTNIQPIGWWMQNHVNVGKEGLNFSEFASYTPKRQLKKLEELIELVKKGAMPLNSYLWIHTDSKLNQQEKELLIKWAESLQSGITNDQ